MTKSEMLVLDGPEYSQMNRSPKDAFYENISLEQLYQVLESEEQLWGEDSGSAVLHWCFKEPYEKGFAYVPNPDRPSLVILFNKPYGFHEWSGFVAKHA